MGRTKKKYSTAAVIRKVITALMKAPQSRTWPPPIFTLPPNSPPPPTRWMIGLINELVNPVTTAVNAAPITMPTARSMTLPRMMKSLKPLSIDPPRRLQKTL